MKFSPLERDINNGKETIYLTRRKMNSNSFKLGLPHLVLKRNLESAFRHQASIRRVYSCPLWILLRIYLRIKTSLVRF